ncbi:MAG: cysteine hydrolase family protein [Selenomonadales bacterium]|nr:cysteine hydrolase family protein [Selenomonadales bacterium]
MKNLLVVVDYQYDFVEGTLGFPKAKELDAVIAAKVEHYRQGGHEVLFTMDTHADDYLVTQEGRNLPVRHCTKGTPGWQLYGMVGDSALPTDMRIEKGAFGSLELAQYLQNGNYARVEFAGLVSNICVLSNAVIAKAALPEATVIVDATAVASYDELLHKAALDVMVALQISVINRAQGSGPSNGGTCC